MNLHPRITTAMAGTVLASLCGFNTFSPQASRSAVSSRPGASVCSASNTGSGLKQNQPVNVRTGSGAIAFVENLLKTNPRFAKAQQKSEREFGGKAISYTVHEVGTPSHHSSPWQRLVRWLAPTLAAQSYGADDGSGYVVFSTYYDDYSSYWEGNTFGQSYDGVVWETINSGIYTPSNSVLWTGYSDGTAERPLARSREGVNDVLAFFVPALHAQASPCNCAVGQWSRCALENAFAESWSTCAGSVGVCATRIAIYWECVGFSCASRFAGSFINQL